MKLTFSLKNKGCISSCLESVSATVSLSGTFTLLSVENSMGLIIDSVHYNFSNERKENISEYHSGIAIEMADFFLSDLESVRDE